jgi:Cu-Zn family superoxide dismutase
MRKAAGISMVLGTLALVVACGGTTRESSGTEPHDESAAASPDLMTAIASIEPKSGSTLSGTATFEGGAGEVALVLEVENAPPGAHAVHLHEIGDCSAPDGKSAGGHWNPGGVDHGQWGKEPFHLGDVGNLEVGDDGKGSLTMMTDLWSIGTGSENDVVGRAIIVHQSVDDFVTQPTGAAGGRIGCGVVELQ